MDQICCRLCMQEHPKMIRVFGMYRNYVVSDLIKKFIPELFLSEIENLSKVICRSCFNILSNVEELRQSSIDNDRIQRSMIDDKKFVDVKVEIDEDFFEPVCNSYFTPEIEDHKPVDRLQEEVNIKDYGVKRSKKLRTKESRQEPPERRTCSLCGKLFSRRDYMLFHCSKQHNSGYSGSYRCDMCSGQKTFRLRARLEEHMRIVHLNSDDSGDFKYFQCEECKSTYMNARDLISHNFYVHGIESKKPRIIKSCKSRQFRADTMLNHKKNIHKTETKFNCDLCNTPFDIKAKLQEHLMTVHMKILDSSANDKLKYYECQACSESYLNFDELQSHSLFVHSKPLYRKDSSKSNTNRPKRRIKTDPDYFEPFSCELCPESFSKEHRLIDHRLKIHSTGYKCLKCDILFEAKKDLLFHNHIHVDFVRKLSAEEITMKYECILCAFKCYQENDLYQHLPCHVNEFALNTSGKLLVCNNCSTILKDYDSLHSHVGVHNEVVSYECLKCNKKFPMGNRLLRHLIKHKVNEKVKCPYENCSYYCATKPQMKDHIKHKHMNEVVHLCAICGQSFGQPGSLRNHIKNIHDKSNHIYQCNMCPKTFRVPSHLRNHQAVHTTEFNFKCEHPGCTKAFRAKRNLQIHNRFHDRSQLNYKWPCDYCERKFLTRDAVKRHSFSHTKVKPYICTFSGCDRAFSQSNDLNKHLRTHYQQEETYFCSHQDCKQSFRLKSELRYHEGLHYRNQDPAPKESSV